MDLRVRDGDLDPQLLDQAVLTARVAAEAKALEAKSRAVEATSRAIRNIVVPILVLAVGAFVVLRCQP